MAELQKTPKGLGYSGLDHPPASRKVIMPTKETTAQLITNLRAYLLSGWVIPREWVGELFGAYLAQENNVLISANQTETWRRAYSALADRYRNLLASKPEVYLVDGHDAAFWARLHTLACDNATMHRNERDEIRARHEALSTEYLALRKQSWENEYKDMYASYAALNREYSDLRVKYDRLQRVATECEDELREIRQINS